MPVSAHALPILSDNYAWLLRDEATGVTAIVDPADADPCIAAIEQAGRRLDLILITHHHGDHIAGVDAVRARFGARVAGAAADRHRLPKLDIEVREGDRVPLGESGFEVIDTPGHTIGHISYFSGDGDVLLCADTLFSLGCGRLLEGTAADMFGSLQKLARLPGGTLVCCGHEYTLANCAFAETVDPRNTALSRRLAQARAQRAHGAPTVPVSLAEERACNPFLRVDTDAIVAALPDALDRVGRFAELRRRKDGFRAAVA